MKENLAKEMGERIASLLYWKRKTVREWANYIGTSLTNAYEIRQGKVTMTPDKILKTAEFFGITVGQLLGTEPLNIEAEVIFTRTENPQLIDLIRKEVDRIIEERLKEKEKKTGG